EASAPSGLASMPRSRTALGPRQDFGPRHEEIRSGGSTPVLSLLEGQAANLPGDFDHSRLFPLIGGHAGLECEGCHRLPHPSTPPRPFPFPFEEVRGKTCGECHEKAHRAAAMTRCDECHVAAAPDWASAVQNVSAEKHAVTGFRLLGAHSRVGCEKCHPKEL